MSGVQTWTIAGDPHPRVPAVNLAIADDHGINHRDPGGLTDVAAKSRAQKDRLADEIRPQPVSTRADWATPHNT